MPAQFSTSPINEQDRYQRSTSDFANLIRRKVTRQPVPLAESIGNVNEALTVGVSEATGDEASQIITDLVEKADEAAQSRGEALLDPDNRDEEIDLARSGAIKIAQGDKLTRREMIVFEAVISAADRPVLDIIDDSYGTAPENWAVLEDYREALKPIFKGVGRIELFPHNDDDYGGTGFVIGPRLVLTNRHVAEIFAKGVGLDIPIRWHEDVWLDFKRENVPAPAPPVMLRVRKIKMIHPYWDAAILEVDGLEEGGITPLSLLEAAPQSVEEMVEAKRSVVVIGYPAIDLALPLDIQSRVFRNKFSVKRLQPGRVRGERMLNWLGQNVQVFAHDSSTLGGNSGSAVVDLETNAVLGLHFAGEYKVANYAVPAWELVRDPKIRSLGVKTLSLPGTTASTDAPVWLRSWDGIPPTPPVTSTATPITVTTPAAADWYERHNDSEIAALWQRDSDEVEALLREVLQLEEAKEFINLLRSGSRTRATEVLTTSESAGPQQEWPFSWHTPAPDRPDVVVLHGIMGGHLAGDGGFMPRLWLNPAAFLVGNVAERLTLAKAGNTNRLALHSDGIIRFSYGSLMRYLCQARFGVAPFAYDWRKSLHHSAELLFLRLKQRRIENPTRDLSIVAHSMGGLVVNLCATLHPEIVEWVKHVVLLGSPLHGSFAPVHAILGTYDLINKLAAISRNDNETEMRQMALSFPGLLEMLPDPTIFPECDVLYKSETWPSDFSPSQNLLDNALEVQANIYKSPWLNEARDSMTLIVSSDFGTTASFDSNPLAAGPYSAAGDGTVPILSAMHSSVSAFRANENHGMLPRSAKVQAAVEALLIGNACPLPLMRSKDAREAKPRPETIKTLREFAESINTTEAIVRRERLQRGLWTQADWDWLTARL